VSAVDTIARQDARQALNEIESHEDLCAERYGNINDTLRTIKSILGWAGGTIFMMLIGVLGWLISQQVGRNDSDRAVLEAKIELLQRPMQQPTTTTTTTTHSGSTAH